MYYPHGWRVSVDGQSVEEFRVNYALRALELPAGNHTIVFEFDPQVVKTGSTISLASNVLLFLLLLGGIFYQYKNRTSKEN